VRKEGIMSYNAVRPLEFADLDNDGIASDTTGKALRLLIILSEYPDGRQVSELAREAGYPVSTTHRLLGSLAKYGFVTTVVNSRRYVVGLRLFELGQRVSQSRGFGGVAIPLLQEVTARSEHVTLLAVRDGQQQVYVHSIQSPRPLQIRAEVGRRGPLHCTAMGKVLVAFNDKEVRDALVSELPLERLTAKTIVDRSAFVSEIARVREQGYGISAEEHDVGVNSIAVPVLDTQRVAIAALGLAAPSSQASIEDLIEYLPLVQTFASKLSLLLPHQ
jgi:IclR family acetate operon transcriptional repressor